MNAVNSFVNLLAAYKKGGTTKRKEWLRKATNRMKKKGTVGAFTEYCGGKVTADCIERGLRSPDPKIRRRAAFAKAVRSFNKAYGGQTGNTMGFYDMDEFVKNSKADFLRNMSSNVLNRMAEDLERVSELNEEVRKLGGMLERMYQEGGNIEQVQEPYEAGEQNYAEKQENEQLRLQVIDTLTYEEYVLATHKHPEYLQRLLSELESVNNQNVNNVNAVTANG